MTAIIAIGGLMFGGSLIALVALMAVAVWRDCRLDERARGVSAPSPVPSIPPCRGRRADLPATAFRYVATDIPAGMTVRDWRRARGACG